MSKPKFAMCFDGVRMIGPSWTRVMSAVTICALPTFESFDHDGSDGFSTPTDAAKHTPTTTTLRRTIGMGGEKPWPSAPITLLYVIGTRTRPIARHTSFCVPAWPVRIVGERVANQLIIPMPIQFIIV